MRPQADRYGHALREGPGQNELHPEPLQRHQVIRRTSKWRDAIRHPQANRHALQPPTLCDGGTLDEQDDDNDAVTCIP